MFDAFGFASDALNDRRPPGPDSESRGTIMRGHLPRARLVTTYGSTFRAALFGFDEPPIWLRLTKVDAGKAAEEAAATGEPGYTGKLGGVIQFFNDAAAVQFVMYYERHIHWPKAQAMHDVGRLEATWAFGRVVRNAIGHAGLISINDKTFKPVTWEGLTYGPVESGRKIIGPDLHAPDLILLMMEMDRALTEMGYSEPSP